MSDVLARVRLTPTQARTTAQRRFEDAEYLRRSDENARANGTVYLAGVAIDCLLKAALLDDHPELVTSANEDALSKAGRHVRDLIYRSHALDQMLKSLPDLRLRLESNDKRYGTRLLDTLTRICETWTIFVRYSPQSMTMAEAAKFLERVREVKEWLK